MKLKRSERDYYVLDIGVTPALAGEWQASFDGEASWVNGVQNDDDQWTWLVAGPDFSAAAVNMSDDDTAATLTESVRPMLRNADNPVLAVEPGPRITLVSA